LAGKSDIEAARAFVRLFLKNDFTKQLAKTLTAGGESLRSFGAGVMKAGAGVSAVGGAMLAPIVAGVKTFMDMGGAAVDAAARTGLSVEALSELGFAAEQTGADMGAVEGAIRKTSVAVEDLSTGSKAAVEKFAKLGLSLADLQGLSPDEQFSKIGGAIAAIHDPTMRAAAAVDMFGKSGTVLLPMLGDMEALRQKARDLGIVMSTEDANAADDLGDAWDALKAQGKTIFFQIGAAVAGPLKEYAGRAAEMAKRAIDWAKANGPLIVTFAKVAVGVSLAGAAIVGIGGAIAGLGWVLTGAATIVSAFGVALGLLTSPVGLLTAGLIAGAVGWLKWSDSGKNAVASIKNAFGPMVGTVTDSVKGIVATLVQGDFASAGAIAAAGFRVAVLEGIEGIGALLPAALQPVTDVLRKVGGLLVEGKWGELGKLALTGLTESFTWAMATVKANWDIWLKSLSDKLYEVIGEVWGWWKSKVTDMTERLLGTKDQQQLNAVELSEATKKRDNLKFAVQHAENILAKKGTKEGMPGYTEKSWAVVQADLEKNKAELAKAESRLQWLTGTGLGGVANVAAEKPTAAAGRRADTSVADREAARTQQQAVADAAEQRLKDLFGVAATPEGAAENKTAADEVAKEPP
jgi:hypothetical protein